MAKKGEKPKFKVKAELAIYEALQENGKLSEEKIAKKTKISATTVHYALERLKKRDFFDILAMPKLQHFQDEIPMAVIGFNDVDPRAIQKVKEEYGNSDMTLMLLCGDRELVLFWVEQDTERLTKAMFRLMELVDSKPSTYMISPQITKCDFRLPKKVLEDAYGKGLVDRQIKV